MEPSRTVFFFGLRVFLLAVITHRDPTISAMNAGSFMNLFNIDKFFILSKFLQLITTCLVNALLKVGK